MPRTTATAAGLIAILAWVGLAVQFDASFQSLHSIPNTTWIMLRYFTILTNLSVAVIFTAMALGLKVRASILGGVTISILLVGIVYGILLRGLIELSGGAKLADFILHTAVPILVPLYWLVLAERGELRRRDSIYWMAIPISYFIYALILGAYEGVYAYPFLDFPTIGIRATAAYAIAMAMGFYATGWIMWHWDNRDGRSRTQQ